MGEFNYNKDYKNWKWQIPDIYNIGYDIVDKHVNNKKKDKLALIWENERGDSKKFTFNDIKILSNKYGSLRVLEK